MLGLDPRAARYTWTAAAVLLSLWLLYLIRGTLFVFAIALMFAYLLYPLFDWIDRKLQGAGRTGTRTPALAITFLVMIGILAAFGGFIASHVGAEAVQLAAQVRRPDFAESFRRWQVLGLPMGRAIAEHYGEIVGALPRLSLEVISATTNAVYLVIIPILSFLILREGRHIRDGFLEMLNGGRNMVEDTLNDAHELMLQYMRALLVLCLATLVAFSAALSLLGVPYAILLASIAFPLEFIPLVGPLSAAAIVLAVSVFSGYPHVLWVAAFLGGYRVFQDYVLSPHLMSKGVELHPLLVMFGVFAGGEVGGVAGIFLSVPILALARLAHYRLRKSRLIAPPGGAGFPSVRD